MTVLNQAEIAAAGGVVRTVTPMLLPNGLAGATTGKGPTITGFAVRPTDGRIYAADGVGLPRFNSAGNRNPALFSMRRFGDSLTFIQAWYLLDMGVGVNIGNVNTYTIQGVTWREANNNIYFVAQTADSAKIIEFSPDLAISGGNAAAGVVSVIDFASLINGLAVDNALDQFIAGTGSSARRRVISTFATIGATFTFPYGDVDHFYHDKNTGIVYVSHGDNGIPGIVSSYVCTPDLGNMTLISEVTLSAAQAIEGLYRDSSEMLVGNDAYYHNSSADINSIISYKTPPI